MEGSNYLLNIIDMDSQIQTTGVTIPLPDREGAGVGLQYIELYTQARQVIFDHAPEAMNAVRDEAFEDFRRQGFPSKKVERYKYTDIQKLFAPDYGVNLSRLQIPVDPYEAFRCDVPNLSTSLYFVVNDMFFRGEDQTYSPPK